MAKRNRKKLRNANLAASQSDKSSGIQGSLNYAYASNLEQNLKNQYII